MQKSKFAKKLVFSCSVEYKMNNFRQTEIHVYQCKRMEMGTVLSSAFKLVLPEL